MKSGELHAQNKGNYSNTKVHATTLIEHSALGLEERLRAKLFCKGQLCVHHINLYSQHHV